MKTLTARFTGDMSSLVVLAKAGKKGIAVLARVKTPDGKSRLGCRNLFVLGHEQEASAKFEELRKDALAKGWVEKVKTPRAADAFVTIPMPADLRKPAPVAPSKKK